MASITVIPDSQGSSGSVLNAVTESLVAMLTSSTGPSAETPFLSTMSPHGSTTAVVPGNSSGAAVHHYHFLSGPTARGISGACTFAALFITCFQIYKHLRYYNNPNEQRWIVRIILTHHH